MSKLKLISINIEGDRHWERLLPFFEREDADVICVQEIFKNNLNKIESLGYTNTFLPMTLKPLDGSEREFGIAIFTKATPEASETFYYHQAADELLSFDREHKHHTMGHGIIMEHVSHRGETFTIATTHFSWTPDGLVDDHQRNDMESLLSHIKNKQPHIICGDFNIPRGYNELYGELAKHYTDEIPEKFETSLDLTLHKVRNNPIEAKRVAKYMVDYIFSQPPYSASNVRLEFGLSDHVAIVAEIIK